MAEGDLGRLVATLEARAERFDLTLQRAVSRLDKLAVQTEAANARMARSSASLDRALAGVGRGFHALVAAIPIALFGRFVERQVEALAKLSELSEQTGVAASSLRQLQLALTLEGGTAEQASQGMLVFSRNVGQVEAGVGRLTTLLKKLDPAFLEQLKHARNNEEAFRMYADRIAGARDEQERLNLAVTAFGNAGRQFLLILHDGARGVDALKDRLAALGVRDLDATADASRRFTHELKLMREVATTNFMRGLLGVGEGLGKLSDNLDDRTIANLGKLAHNFGLFAAGVASFSLTNLERIADLTDRLVNAANEFEIRFGASAAGMAGGGMVDAVTAAAVGGMSEADLATKVEDAQGRLSRARTAMHEARLRGEIDASNIDRLQAEIDNAQLDVSNLENILLRMRLRRTDTTLAGESGRGRFNARNRPSSFMTAGPQAEDTSIVNARAKILRDQASFLNAMRRGAQDAESEIEKISIRLARTLGKIGQAPGLSQAEKNRLQTEAIDAATAAITKAEEDALRAQAEQVQGFLQQFGADTLTEAQKVSLQVAQGLAKLAEEGRKRGLTPAEVGQQAGVLTAGAQPAIERAAEQDRIAQERFQIEMLTRRSQTSIFPSVDLEREIAARNAKLEAAQRDVDIDKVFAGDPARQAALHAQNAALLDDELGRIESSWDDALTEISGFGEQVFDDMVQGWVQGADVSFNGIAKSFAAMLVKMQVEAMAHDMWNMLTGGQAKPTNLVGMAVGGVIGKLTGKSKGEEDAKQAEAAGDSISAKLLSSLEDGADTLVKAGRGAGDFISNAAGVLYDAGAAVARAIINALASSAFSSGGGGGGGWLSAILGVVGTAIGGYFGGPAGAAAGSAVGGTVGGGVPVQGGRAVRVAEGGLVKADSSFVRIVALAEGGGVAELAPTQARGGYVAPRIERLDRMTKRGGPTIQVSGKGSSARRSAASGVHPSVRSQSQTFERSTSSRERDTASERVSALVSSHDQISSRDSSSSLSATNERDSSALVSDRSMSDRSTTRDRSVSDRSTRSDRSTFERSVVAESRVFERSDVRSNRAASPDRGGVTALVGEAGVERLLTMDRVREITMESGGDPAKAVRIAIQSAERLDKPEVRHLKPGDVVIPDRKLQPFFAGVLKDTTPASIAMAEGGYVSSLGAIPMPEAMNIPLGGLTVKLEQTVAPDVKASPVKMTRGPSGEVILQQMVTRAVSRDAQMNGPISQRLMPSGPQGGLR